METTSEKSHHSNSKEQGNRIRQDILQSSLDWPKWIKRSGMPPVGEMYNNAIVVEIQESDPNSTNIRKRRS